jgi:hypothetical protein
MRFQLQVNVKELAEHEFAVEVTAKTNGVNI